jgi:hypothetical protein
MFKRSLALSVSSFSFIMAICAGCATPTYNYSPKRVDISEPPLNSSNVAQVGDVMIRQRKYTEHDAIYLPQDTHVGFIGTYTLRRGFYLKQGEDDTTAYYLPSPVEGGQIIKGPIADPPKIVQAYRTEPKLCVVTVFNVSTCKEGAAFERKTQPIESRDSFQQALIYSGKVGNKINVGYREFSGNMARPAFNNQVEYDLNDSKFIGYKGARIEVLEATNEHIRYKVLRNFNEAKF